MLPAGYVAQVKQSLEPLADSNSARQMSAYLRDQFSFLGLAAPMRRQALKSLPKPEWQADDLLEAAQLLWRLPEREYRYVAIDMLGRHAKKLRLTDINQLLMLVQRDPWWETVDSMAAIIGDIIAIGRKTDPDAQLAMDRLLRHANFWLRRTAMLHQLGWRLETDEKRLFAYAEQLAPETEFFIRKAIGWALRDYARWKSAAVESFIRENRHLFAGLTINEAMKHL